MWPFKRKPVPVQKYIDTAEPIYSVDIKPVTYNRLHLGLANHVTILSNEHLLANVGDYYITYDDGSTEIMTKEQYNKIVQQKYIQEYKGAF